MKLSFFKYQGAGNDFIMVDNRDLSFNHHQPKILEQICDRRFGVGGDGIMFIEPAEGFDFKMVYYNADGQPSSMCGNGGRCIVAFAKQLGIIDSETNFVAVDGPHYAKIADSGDWVSLQMIDVDVIKRDGDAYVINTGSPHYIKFDLTITDKNVFEEGRAIRYNDTYKKEGININFVEDKGDHLFVRTYERGVEDETYACGTGVTAVALANALAKNQTGKIETSIKVLGGELNIRFDYDGKKFTNIFLEGPAKMVFEGELEA
ncbi:MAG: diaminopimelate epimerase [Bacteroidetes bacterium]|nr:diaminopimelate epimerase [Bacteroidota bacterium]MBU1373124.1 diaminopimelate epimerase [Bacteroidota bacterium]MBU1484306.1 diaminopimelate epimerase [Bacteroidota bacterium]MBU1760247.1 diaminopimelate epimerase [Bacteroidota bacterium]MBU2046979.1 diaminopimelate epimerase [Bacteroidota bacterium]